VIVSLTVWSVIIYSGAVAPDAWKGLRRNLIWTIGTGVSLAIAVTSLFRALSLGPASVVVPIYGMFILGAPC
jgi:bacterial/archaeal transporter family protein